MSPGVRRFIAYYRVSTDKQGQSGLGLASPTQGRSGLLGRRSVGTGGRIYGGREREARRPPRAGEGLGSLPPAEGPFGDCQTRPADPGRRFIATVMESGVEFVAVDNPHANKLTVHILAAVAQHERGDDFGAHEGCPAGGSGPGHKEWEIRVSWRLPSWGGRRWPRLGSNLRQTCYPSFGIFRKAVPRAPTPSPLGSMTGKSPPGVGDGGPMFEVNALLRRSARSGRWLLTNLLCVKISDHRGDCL